MEEAHAHLLYKNSNRFLSHGFIAAFPAYGASGASLLGPPWPKAGEWSHRAGLAASWLAGFLADLAWLHVPWLGLIWLDFLRILIGFWLDSGWTWRGFGLDFGWIRLGLDLA